MSGLGGIGAEVHQDPAPTMTTIVPGTLLEEESD